jgi:hypothetical protein
MADASANGTFYYPNRSSPDGSGGTVAVNGPVGGGQNVSPQARFVSGRTVNGTVYAYQKNDVTQNVWTLDFADLTAAQRTSLQTFFNDKAKGPSNPFDYTHTSGTEYSAVKFEDNVLRFRRIDGGAFFSCTLKLIVPSEVVS